MRVDTMIDRVVARFIGTKHERDVKQIQPLVTAINALAPEYEQLSDAQLLEKITQLRAEVKERLGDLPLDDPQFKERCKEALQPALVSTFALVREAGRRKLGMRHFDVQLIGGIVLHEGKIAEMKTGEGKTLVATLPAVLNALTSRGVRIVKIIPKLIQDIDYTVDEKHRTATLTEEGVSKTEKLLGLGNMYDPQHMETIHHVYQGLRAHTLYHRDVEYVVKNGEVIIVDEFTGREMPGRRWSDGLHQAVEAKEGVKIERENQTLATITFQNYFRMYKKLSCMTGTAETEATEFNKIYKLDGSLITTNRPLRRAENPDVVYRTAAEKYEAVVNGIMQEDNSYAYGLRQIHESGQPVLVGTISIEKSEHLANLLKKAGIPHQVLNAKQHEREAKVIAQAGRKGAVTVSTNMAGRGTDILLGGNPEAMTRDHCLREKLAIPYIAAPAVIGADASNGDTAPNMVLFQQE